MYQPKVRNLSDLPNYAWGTKGQNNQLWLDLLHSPAQNRNKNNFQQYWWRKGVMKYLQQFLCLHWIWGEEVEFEAQTTDMMVIQSVQDVHRRNNDQLASTRRWGHCRWQYLIPLRFNYHFVLLSLTYLF